MLPSVAKPAAALALAALSISIILLALGASPIGVFAALGEGAFGSWYAFTDTIVKATPLVFTGLAISLAFSGALWNIGADGQLVIGAIAAGAIGPWLGDWPHPVAIAVVLSAGAVGGAIWGGLAGWLRARRDVNEVISTIMLNFVAAQMLSWVVHGPLMEPSRSYPASSPIAASAELGFYFAPSRLNLGMLIAVILAAACYVVLFHTSAGFELRAMGRNRRAATFFRIRIERLTIVVMALSGALAGLGGAVQVSAITHRLFEKLSPGWGYEAIAVALVAHLNPLGIIAAALFFGALDNGSQAMQRSQNVSPVLVQVIQGMVILFLLAFDTPLWSGMRKTMLGDSVMTDPIAAAELPDA
ncbi:MAG: ABC transporter permease [Candidatus Binatus sp.]|uniref:ABC transporter permease n=1 Tax=Candidatus Binatus sp. TaxID=2811406 RepID=UPI0027236D7A|nr:ABC transporter permease [Candidatus Binatus sp.]MDO8432268.1 ABC transporter permease [Candidatus Binatus sp.]